MGEFDDLIEKYSGETPIPADGEYSDLIQKYMPPEQRESDVPGIMNSLGTAASSALLKASEYIPGPVKALANITGAAGGLVGAAIDHDTYWRVYGENMARIAPRGEIERASLSDKARALPGLGEVFLESTRPETPPEGLLEQTGEAARTAGGFILGMGSDPATFAGAGLGRVPGLARVALGAEELTPGLARTLRVPETTSRLGAAGKAFERTVGSPLVGAAYGPDVLAAGAQGLAEGNTPQALLMAGLAGLMGKGIVDEVTAAKAMRSAGIEPEVARPPIGEDLGAFPSRIPEGLAELSARFPEQPDPESFTRTIHTQDYRPEPATSGPRRLVVDPDLGEFRVEEPEVQELEPPVEPPASPAAPRAAERPPASVPEAVLADQPKTGPAVWKNKDSDVPVEVEGIAGTAPDGRTYLKIKGSDTAVPADEVQFAEKPQTLPDQSSPVLEPPDAPQRQSEGARLAALPEEALAAELKASLPKKLREVARELYAEDPVRLKELKAANSRQMTRLILRALADKRAKAAGAAETGIGEAGIKQLEDQLEGPPPEGSIKLMEAAEEADKLGFKPRTVYEGDVKVPTITEVETPSGPLRGEVNRYADVERTQGGTKEVAGFHIADLDRQRLQTDLRGKQDALARIERENPMSEEHEAAARSVFEAQEALDKLGPVSDKITPSEKADVKNFYIEKPSLMADKRAESYSRLRRGGLSEGQAAGGAKTAAQKVGEASLRENLKPKVEFLPNLDSAEKAKLGTEMPEGEEYQPLRANLRDFLRKKGLKDEDLNVPPESEGGGGGLSGRQQPVEGPPPEEISHSLMEKANRLARKKGKFVSVKQLAGNLGVSRQEARRIARKLRGQEEPEPARTREEEKAETEKKQIYQDYIGKQRTMTDPARPGMQIPIRENEPVTEARTTYERFEDRFRKGSDPDLDRRPHELNQSFHVEKPERIDSGFRPDSDFEPDLLEGNPELRQEIAKVAESFGITRPSFEFVGSGSYNRVYKIGFSQKLGEDLAVRIGDSDVPVPKKSWMLPFHKTFKTASGKRVDIVPVVEGSGKYGDGRFWKEFDALQQSLPASGYEAVDMASRNVGYYKGKLVVIDPGAVIPLEPHLNPDHYLARQDVHYEGAAKAQREAISAVNRMDSLKGLKIIPAEESPVRRVYDAFKKSAEEAAKRGVKTLKNTIREDLDKQGWVSLEGLTIGHKDPIRDIAILGQLVRQPFEVLHVISWDKAGKIVSDKAITAGLPNSVPAHKSKSYHLEMTRLGNKHLTGEVAGYALIHNHPGGMPEPSDSDVEMYVALKNHPLHKKGLKGSVITDHGRFGYVTEDKLPPGGPYGGPASDDGEWRFDEDTMYGKAHDRLTQEELESVGLSSGIDPLFKETPLTDVAGRGDAVRRLAAMAQTSWADDGVRYFLTGNTGALRAIGSAPFNAFTNPKWFARHLRDAGGSTAGGFPILYFEPKNAAQMERFLDIVDDLYKDRAIFDAIVPAKMMKTIFPENSITAKTFPDTGHVSIVETLAWKRRLTDFKHEGPIEMAQDYNPEAPEQIKAKEAAQEAIDATPARVPKRVVEPESVEAKGSPKTAKPGGDPDIGINWKKDFPHLADLPEATQKEYIRDFQALNDQLKRAMPKANDYEAMARRAMTLLDGQKTVEQVLMPIRGEGDIATVGKRTTLAGMMMQNKGLEADRLMAEWRADTNDEGKKAAALAAQMEARAWAMQFIDRKTETARLLKALDVYKDLKKLDPRLSEIDRWMRTLKARGVPDKVINALKNTYINNPEEFPDAFAKAMDPSWLDKFIEYRTAGLVSGPATRLANLGSNLIFRGLRDMENILSSGIDIARAKITKTDRERYFGESKALMMAYKHAMSGPEGALARWIAERGGFTTKNLSDPFGGSFLDQNRSNLGAIGGKVGQIIRMPFKWLEVDDAFFKHLSAAQEVFRRAARTGIRRGLKGKELDEFISNVGSQLLDVARHGPESKYYSEDFKLLYEDIQRKMLDDTFQDPLSGIFAQIQSLQRNHPLARLILPFVKTPSNIFIEAIKRTPAGFGMTWASYKKGLLQGGELSEELAKNLMGSAIAMGVVLMAYQGMFTGGGPADPSKQQMLRDTGWLPYAFHFGDQYLSFQRFEPVSSLIGMAADAAELAKSGQLKNPGEAAEKILASINQNLTDKTFLQGVGDFFTAWSDPRQYFPAYLRNQAGTIIPRVVSRAAAALDPTIRRKGNLLEGIQAQVPGASTLLEPYVKGSGEVSQRGMTGAERFASPLIRSSEKDAMVEREFIRLDKPLRAPSRQATIGGVQVDLTKDEYSRMLKARQAAMKRAERVIKDPTYLALPDNASDPRFRFGRTTKEDVLDKIFREYQRLATAMNRKTTVPRAMNPGS